MDSLTDEQRRILRELTNLNAKAACFQEKLDALRPTENGIVIIGGAFTVCETEDDFIIISAVVRQELERAVEKIKEKLNEALDNKLGHLGIIQRQCKAYGVKP